MQLGMTSPVLHGDDTPVNVLAPGAGKTKTGRLWAYVRDALSVKQSIRGIDCSEKGHGGERPPCCGLLLQP
jgi:hypothetical protein